MQPVNSKSTCPSTCRCSALVNGVIGVSIYPAHGTSRWRANQKGRPGEIFAKKKKPTGTATCPAPFEHRSPTSVSNGEAPRKKQKNFICLIVFGRAAAKRNCFDARAREISESNNNKRHVLAMSTRTFGAESVEMHLVLFSRVAPRTTVDVPLF